MPVYMIQGDGALGPIKIGHSDDPQFRLGQLQVSHWETLRIIRLFEGGEAEEAMLHLRFADLYIRGEWHNFSRAMLRDVGLVEIAIEPAPLVLPKEIRPLLMEEGASLEAAHKNAVQIRIRSLSEQSGLSLSSLASCAGIAASTLTRFMNSADATHVLSSRTLARIEAAAAPQSQGEAA